MALNWTMLSPNRSPVPLPNEMTITNIDSGAELSLTIPATAPTGNSSAGGSGGSRKLKALGKIWLTDQRLIFAADAGASFESLSVPLYAVLSTKFEQPTFGANYLAFEIKPSDGGGLSDGTKAELRFKDRAMFEFVSLLEKTRERAIYMKRQAAEDDDLPTYTSPAESSSAYQSLSMGAPVDNPPGYNA
ncbi:putative female pronucleus assembly protein [Lyophyllum shimeji]|uniref:Female pronucleus assembly protein n=1 Tax=Lyophyllum shimeji TaxID=47721 RepID=A0A9P3PE56_LYOSH|nr:putative female pronucleus assembly protein [Lyophyllum shimeji]